jgi:hypothetical protein
VTSPVEKVPAGHRLNVRVAATTYEPGAAAQQELLPPVEPRLAGHSEQPTEEGVPATENLPAPHGVRVLGPLATKPAGASVQLVMPVDMATEPAGHEAQLP